MVSTAGGIVIAIIVLVLAAAVGWIVFTQLRARRLGVRRLISLSLSQHQHLRGCFPSLVLFCSRVLLFEIRPLNMIPSCDDSWSFIALD